MSAVLQGTLEAVCPLWVEQEWTSLLICMCKVTIASSFLYLANSPVSFSGDVTDIGAMESLICVFARFAKLLFLNSTVKIIASRRCLQLMFLFCTTYSFKLLEYGSESSEMCEKVLLKLLFGLNAVVIGN